MRFSLRALLLAIPVVALGVSGFVFNLAWATSLIYTICVAALLFAVVGVAFTRSDQRLYWAGFAALGWGYWFWGFDSSRMTDEKDARRGFSAADMPYRGSSPPKDYRFVTSDILDFLDRLMPSPKRIGTRVWAQYRDTYFYSGKIVDYQEPNFLVAWDDGNRGLVAGNQIYRFGSSSRVAGHSLFCLLFAQLGGAIAVWILRDRQRPIAPRTDQLVSLAACVLFPVAGCGEESARPTAHSRSKATPQSSVHNSPTNKTSACSGIQYGRPRALARLEDDRINESSGLARSLIHHDRFWTHNDGNSPRLYCIDKRGKTVGTVKLEGAKFVDCEDIAAFTRDGKDYLLYADTGDNELNRREYQLHLIKEPRLKSDKKKPHEVDVEMTIPFRYPDGPHDCEAVAVDPTTGTVYLTTKEAIRGANVYELSLPAIAPDQPLEARFVARLEVTRVAAMDISPDGRRAVVSSSAAAFEFARRGDEDWGTAFRWNACRLTTPQRQNGESICYGADGKTLYLTSEGRNEPLWEIPAE